jgi:ribosomal protein S18 acetylase RimI-like enzyme
MEPVVRSADIDDAAAIASVHVRAWQAAYRHIFGAALDTLSLEARERMWRGWLGRPEALVLCAEQGGAVVGFASVGAAVDDAAMGELYALYLLPEAWGSGLAPLLADAAVAALAANGFSEAVLWVLEDNPRARRFYERTDWVADGGARIGEHLGVATPELRYRRTLG